MVYPAAAAGLCSVFTLIIASLQIKYAPTPHGSCIQCCPVRFRDDIAFLLYTRNNANSPLRLYPNDVKRLGRSGLDFKASMAVLVHGFMESATFPNESSQQMKNAFLEHGNYNVILVDWSVLSAGPWYANAVDNVKDVGQYLAHFVRFLIAQNYPIDGIHLIGFSLGAEVIGFAGAQLRSWGLLLPRITGLDPANPIYGSNHHRRGLHKSVAHFVDVLHTNNGLLGNPQPAGHADFYPNGGGRSQPGCWAEIDYPNIFGLCAHMRSWRYFVESVKSPEAFPVDGCKPTRSLRECQWERGRTYMGLAADSRLRGSFYLKTNGVAPFGRNFTKRHSQKTVP